MLIPFFPWFWKDGKSLHDDVLIRMSLLCSGVFQLGFPLFGSVSQC